MRWRTRGAVAAGALLLSACADVVAPPPGRYLVIVPEQAEVTFTVDPDHDPPENLIVTIRYDVELRNADAEPLRLVGCREDADSSVVLPAGAMRVDYGTEARVLESFRAHCDSPASYMIPAYGSVKFDVVLTTGLYSRETFNAWSAGTWRFWFLTTSGPIWSPRFVVPELP